MAAPASAPFAAASLDQTPCLCTDAALLWTEAPPFPSRRRYDAHLALG